MSRIALSRRASEDDELPPRLSPCLVAAVHAEIVLCLAEVLVTSTRRAAAACIMAVASRGGEDDGAKRRRKRYDSQVLIPMYCATKFDLPRFIAGLDTVVVARPATGGHSRQYHVTGISAISPTSALRTTKYWVLGERALI